MARLLLIDSEAFLSESFAHPPLADDRWICDRANWSSFVFESLGQRVADLIVAAAVPSRTQFLDFFRWLREHPVRSPTIAVLPEDPGHDLLGASFEVADDCVLCPFRPEELRQRIARILGPEERGCAAVRDRLNSGLGLTHLVGKDPVFLHEIARIPLAARSDNEVLITGETGTGKELCARAIHHLSRRRSFPFVCVDCGALPEPLFENELFGHERGAFTDAHRAQRGLVAIADKGTLFLDELDSLSLPAQAKLLRFLQDRTYKPLGAEQFARADVRIVAATNGDLERAVNAKVFRRDLFFRINVLRLHLVPLRERRDDIELLSQHFLNLCCAEMGGPRKVLAPSSLQLLRSFEWPGNVRELYNVIRQAVVFSDGPWILPAQLLPARQAMPVEGATLSFREARTNALTAFERRYVEDMLRKHDGNITRAARAAGKDRRAFGRLVKRHQINPLDLK